MILRGSRLVGLSLRAKRLCFEALERRDLLAVMRIVDWNTLNGPNDAAGDANFQTIFQAIGNETVQGNTQRINILALQETDPAGPGGDSITRVQSILNGLYTSANYEYVVSAVDGGGDSTGFVYDTTSVSLLESVVVGSNTLTHNVVRAKFRPTDTLGESDFYVYSVHLKSGDTGADATIRGSEAALLRADADSLNEGASVLFVGDFNMKTSSETAWANFTAVGPGQVQDVANAPGSWYNNAAFKSLHSQDPKTSMDDRFDIQFASGEFYDGIGVDYVMGSYHVFGNNGTHTFDGPITTGTGASTDVLNALFAASDHLPVVADYQLIVSTPKVRISETLGGTKVVEGGLYDTYQVMLDTVPAANVSVTVTPNSQVDVGNGAGVPLVLTFTPANALAPQTVVVRAADDAAGEGDHTGLITHTSASTDVSYNGLAVASVNVAIVDNDAPKIVINEIDADQAATDMAEFVELYDGGVGNVSLNGKILVFFNGAAANDGSYLTIDLSGKSTNAAGFFVVGNAGVAGAGLTFPNNTLQNGADAVALYSALASAFPNGTAPTLTGLLDAIVYDTDDADDAGLLALLDNSVEVQPQVNENQNGGTSGETQSLARVPDGGAPRQTSTYVAQTPTPGTYNQLPPVGVQFVQSGARVDVAEGGGADSYQIALDSIPTANVTITVDPDGQTDLGAGAGVAIVLVFTPANALIPQTVMVTAIDDAAVEGTHTSVITHTATSADARYNGLAISNVVANITDNDTPPPVSIVISEIMYNPASSEGNAASPEWVEVVNTGAAAVDLGGWLFDDEDSSNWGAIPANTVLNPNQIAVFFDATLMSAAQFRTDWAVPAGALVVGIGWGNLANTPSPTNEILQLFNNIGVEMDVVNFDDASPWPGAADGPSIYLKNLSADNNNGANWGRSAAGVGGAVSPTGATFSPSDVGSPGRVFLAGDFNLNGSVDAADYVLWRKTLGSTTNLQADQSGPSVGVPNGVVDQADYAYWRSNFGATGVPNGGLGSGAELAAGQGGGGSSALLVSMVDNESAPLDAPAESVARDAAFSGLGVSLPTMATPTRVLGTAAVLGSVAPSNSSGIDDLLAIIEESPAAAATPYDVEFERLVQDDVVASSQMVGDVSLSLIERDWQGLVAVA